MYLATFHAIYRIQEILSQLFPFRFLYIQLFLWNLFSPITLYRYLLYLCVVHYTYWMYIYSVHCTPILYIHGALYNQLKHKRNYLTIRKKEIVWHGKIMWPWCFEKFLFVCERKNVTVSDWQIIIPYQLSEKLHHFSIRIFVYYSFRFAISYFYYE